MRLAVFLKTRERLGGHTCFVCQPSGSDSGEGFIFAGDDYPDNFFDQSFRFHFRFKHG